MSALTIHELTEILIESGGLDQSATDVALDGGPSGNPQILDVLFVDLGVDSVMLMDSASRIERRCDIVLDDDLLASASTPRMLLDAVNARTAS